MLTRTVLREGQALAKENGAALEVVRNIREVNFCRYNRRVCVGHVPLFIH